MMIENQILNAGAPTFQPVIETSSQPRVSTEKMLNEIAEHLEGLLGDLPLIRMCTLWIAQVHLGHVWSHCPWLYVGLPGHDQNGQLLLDVLQPMMPVSWYADKETELPRQVALRQRKSVPDCKSKAMSDFLRRLGEASRISALIGHVVDPNVQGQKDSARRAVIITGLPSWRSSAELSKKAVTYTTAYLGNVRAPSQSDVAQAYSLRVELDEWVVAAEDAAWQARTKMPDGLSGATADLWRPMLTIAELAGEEWHAWATQLAMQDALAQTYGALARLSELIIGEECGTGISSWHKTEESQLLAQVRSLINNREYALNSIKPDASW